MRITEGMGYQNMLQDIARAQERVQIAQSQVSSGKKVLSPSDNPSAASDIVRLSGEKIESDQYSKNLIFAESKLTITDNTLDTVQKMVERARTLAQGGLGNPGVAASNVTELNSIRDQLISAANTTHAGRYLFSGSATTTAPYVKNADSSVAYQGNDTDMSLQVDRNLTLQIQVPGSEVFSGSVDIFSVMSDLSTAMKAGDTAAMDAQVTKLEQLSDVISVARTKVGSYLNFATSVEDQLSSAKLTRQSSLNDAQGADLATAISELTLSQQGLQATLAVGARVSQTNILDYLK